MNTYSLWYFSNLSLDFKLCNCSLLWIYIRHEKLICSFIITLNYNVLITFLVYTIWMLKGVRWIEGYSPIFNVFFSKYNQLRRSHKVSAIILNILEIYYFIHIYDITHTFVSVYTIFIEVDWNLFTSLQWWGTYFITVSSFSLIWKENDS